MNRSRYDSRAKLLSKNAHKTLHQELPNRQEYWESRVKTKEDVITFYKLFYPELPDCLTLALADYFERAVEGQIKLPEDFLQADYLRKQYQRDAEEEVKDQYKPWDYEAEIEQQKQEAKERLAQEKQKEIVMRLEQMNLEQREQANDILK